MHKLDVWQSYYINVGTMHKLHKLDVWQSYYSNIGTMHKLDINSLISLYTNSFMTLSLILVQYTS